MARKKAAAAAAKPVVVEGEDALGAREDLVVRALEVALHALPKDLSKLNRGAIKALMVKTVGTGKDALSEEVRGARCALLSVGRERAPCTHHSAAHARPGCAHGDAPMSGGCAARRVSRAAVSQAARALLSPGPSTHPPTHREGICGPRTVLHCALLHGAHTLPFHTLDCVSPATSGAATPLLNPPRPPRRTLAPAGDRRPAGRHARDGRGGRGGRR